MNTTILVTGGAGFIGSNLCKHLLSNNRKVICADDFSTGKESNIAALIQDPNFSLLKWDVTTPIPSCLIGEEISQIYHLACPASPLQYGKDPLKTIHTNYMGTLNVLNLAKLRGARFLLASTSETYGEPLEHPQKETYRGNVNTMGPRACYDEGKRIAETLTWEYNRQYGVEVRIVRIFNTYGPNLSSDDGRVISNFLDQATKNEPITIYGDGSQTRCFCYVDDLIRGLTKLMNYKDNDNNNNNNNNKNNNNKPIVVNLGNDKEFTVASLAELVIKLTSNNSPGFVGGHSQLHKTSKSEIIYRDLPIDDPTKRCPDLTKAKELLDWAPRTSLVEGLTRMIASQQKTSK